MTEWAIYNVNNFKFVSSDTQVIMRKNFSNVQSGDLASFVPYLNGYVTFRWNTNVSTAKLYEDGTLLTTVNNAYSILYPLKAYHTYRVEIQNSAAISGQLEVLADIIPTANMAGKLE